MRLLNQQPLADLITDTVRHLREPAGPAYRTREAIINNREDFIKRFHQALFTTHACAIDGIMTMESKLETQKGSKGSEIAVKRVIQIFHTLNDALVWTLLARDADYWVTRLSRGKPRGRLVDQNPASIIPFLGQVFSSGDKVAIWNDATRCVDLGDVTIFDPKKGLEFAEIKQGKVNEAILETVKAGTVEAIDDFCETFGKRGTAQLQRTVKQQIDAEKHGRLLQAENLIDPFTGLKRVTSTPRGRAP